MLLGTLATCCGSTAAQCLTAAGAIAELLALPPPCAPSATTARAADWRALRGVYSAHFACSFLSQHYQDGVSRGRRTGPRIYYCNCSLPLIFALLAISSSYAGRCVAPAGGDAPVLVALNSSNQTHEFTVLNAYIQRGTNVRDV